MESIIDELKEEQTNLQETCAEKIDAIARYTQHDKKIVPKEKFEAQYGSVFMKFKRNYVVFDFLEIFIIIRKSIEINC